MDTSHTASPPPSGKDISQHSSTVHPPPPAAFPPAAHFRTGYNVGGKDPGASNSTGYCTKILTVFSILVIGATFPFSLCLCIKIVQEYERAVIFRLGRLLQGGAKGPGLFFIIPCIDTYSKVDLRTVSFDVPPQEILSKDSVTVAVDAVVYYRISNATIAITNVEDYGHSTRLLAATTLRNVLGTKNLSEILSERESISHVMQSSLDEATDSWGVKVERVEIKDVRLPVQLQRAMAAEAEATREARAKVIAAEGEQRASRSLKEAAEVIAETPSALQLRYLQTLTSIAAEKNSTIVFPLPMEIMRSIIYSQHHNNNNSYNNQQHNMTNTMHEKNNRNMRHTEKDLSRGDDEPTEPFPPLPDEEILDVPLIS
ncbi:band 7 protein AGAP004871-like [Galendromus occidentalis]|uniref:Band 7 protein AGAP004871-like n=1 Tax=Galendromus occidentalis TaxID=34638 RepID=A0AAJ7SJK9_9ACAR|nr:band 7 protein AGAP004871-like [Galendromus occidentalis]